MPGCSRGRNGRYLWCRRRAFHRLSSTARQNLSASAVCSTGRGTPSGTAVKRSAITHEQ